MSSALFWDVTQPAEVIPYRHFGATYRFLLQGSRSIRSFKIRRLRTLKFTWYRHGPVHTVPQHQQTAILHYFAAQTPNLAQLLLCTNSRNCCVQTAGTVLYKQPELFCTNSRNCCVQTAGTVVYKQPELLCTNSRNCSVQTAGTTFNVNRHLIH
jgi:hypothetical protein